MLVAHKIYGVPQTINTANYVYFLAFKELRSLHAREETDCDTIVTEELLSLHRGQGLELQWRDSLQCPSEEQYIGMVNNSALSFLDVRAQSKSVAQRLAACFELESNS